LGTAGVGVAGGDATDDGLGHLLGAVIGVGGWPGPGGSRRRGQVPGPVVAVPARGDLVPSSVRP
jgi:hypothetical protein